MGGVQCEGVVATFEGHVFQEEVIVQLHSMDEHEVVDAVATNRPKVFGSFWGSSHTSVGNREKRTDKIPIEIGLMTQLISLALGDNDLTGSIPSELGILTQLTGLWLRTNLLTGSLPSELGILTQLTALWLWNNNLTSSLCSVVNLFIDCEEIACMCCISGVTYDSCPL